MGSFIKKLKLFTRNPKNQINFDLKTKIMRLKLQKSKTLINSYLKTKIMRLKPQNVSPKKHCPFHDVETVEPINSRQRFLQHKKKKKNFLFLSFKKKKKKKKKK